MSSKAEMTQPGTPDQEIIHPLPVGISEALLPEAKAFYLTVIPTQLRLRYEQALHDEKRMGGLREEGIPVPYDAESDLQHVVTGCQMAKDWKDRYPALGDHIDWNGVQALYVIHDSGEAAKGIGDVRVTNRTRRDEAKKRYEPIAAKKAVISQIPDPEKREVVTRIYDSYIENDPQNLEVQMARLIDKKQGLEGVAAATSALAASDREVKAKMHTHFLKTIPLITNPALNLMRHLPTEEARAAIQELVNETFDTIARFGHREVVEEFRARQAA